MSARSITSDKETAMSQPVSKTRQAVEKFLSGDVKGALKIAGTFRIGLTKDEQATLKRGYECMINPTFYVQLGKDPEECQRKACSLFRAKWVQPV